MSSPRDLLVAYRGQFSDNGWISVRRPRLPRATLLVAYRGQFSGKTVVCQGADKPISFTVESGPGYLGSASVCGAAKWVKLSESWPKFKFTDFHIM
jgi:hypothetical protein